MHARRTCAKQVLVNQIGARIKFSNTARDLADLALGYHTHTPHTPFWPRHLSGGRGDSQPAPLLLQLLALKRG